MNVLVTGGLGFIGLNFIRYYHSAHKEDKLTVIDNMTYACNEFAVKEHRDKFSFVKGDISDEALIDKLFEGGRFDAVINFAAETHVDNSIKSSHRFYISNVIGVQVLLDACRKYGVKRFHQVSTDEVYGDIDVNDDHKFDEGSRLNPSNPYSASKAAADLLLIAYHRTHKMPITVSRCSNNYGLFQHSEKFIPTIIMNASRGASIPIYGLGENIRNWIHAEDHSRAIDLILRHGRSGEIYNVGSEEYVSNIDLSEMILSRMKIDGKLNSFVADRPGHDRKYALNYEKLSKELHWAPKHRLADDLDELIAYYSSL